MIKWLTVDKEGNEYMHDNKPDMHNDSFWYSDFVNIGECKKIPKGTAEKLLGFKLRYRMFPAAFGEELEW